MKKIKIIYYSVYLLFAVGILSACSLKENSNGENYALSSDTVSISETENTGNTSSSVLPSDISSSLSPESPVVAVADDVSRLLSQGDKGFKIVDENDKVAGAVLSDTVTMTTLEGMEEDSTEAIHLREDTSQAALQEDNLGGVLLTSFYLQLEEASAGDLAKDVNEGNYGLYFNFACNDNGSVPRVYHNGELIKVNANRNGTYSCILYGEGPVVVAVDSIF